MTFFRDLRRRSRANFHQEGASDSGPSSEGSSQAGQPNGESSKSTSSLNSTNGAPSTGPDTQFTQSPSSSIIRSNSRPTQRSASTLQRHPSKAGSRALEQVDEAPPVPPRPQTLVSANKRFSSASGYSQAMTTAPKVPTSAYAPQITSLADGAWVNQKVLLVNGQVGPPDQPLDGHITVSHHYDHFPATTWPVNGMFFKAMIHLMPGMNEIRVDFFSSRLVGTDAPNTLHSTRFRIGYMPLTNAPPLHLAILLAKDSPEVFDAPPEKIQREGNTLEVAIRKYRMAGHLWSAFTAEQMSRNGFGRKTFRFDEEYQQGTLSSRDLEAKALRNETKVHIVRTQRTLAEIRDMEVAQQNHGAKRAGDLFGWAMEAVKDHFKCINGQRQYVACLILDSHWDPQAKLIRGHAALGGGDGILQLGIFGSQALHAYPSCIEDIVPALTDGTKTDTNYIGADGGEDSGTWWQAACIGIGAHLHEVGHLLGCPHQTNGIMAQGYWYFNRTFVTAEPYSTRTKQHGIRPCLPQHEDGWHRLDLLRFRSHPCFRTIYETPLHPERGITVWCVESTRFVITSRTGLNFIELFADGSEFATSWIEYSDRDGVGEGLARHVELSEGDLRAHLPSESKNCKKLKMAVHSLGGVVAEVKDVAKAVSKVRMPRGLTGYLGPKYGSSAMSGSVSTQLVMSSLTQKQQLLVKVRVYHEHAVHGVEIFYEDGTKELFGKAGGQLKDVNFDIRRGETLAGFYIRAGFWIDALAVITSSGRRSEIFGNATGGEAYTLLPPRGFRIAGMHGSCAQWLDGFGIIIAR